MVLIATVSACVMAAIAGILLGPTTFVSCANTELSDAAVAFTRSIGPRYSPSKLCTFQYLLPRKIETGFDTNVESGEMPSFNAVASTNGLNDDPGWRSP